MNRPRYRNLRNRYDDIAPTLHNGQFAPAFPYARSSVKSWSSSPSLTSDLQAAASRSEKFKAWAQKTGVEMASQFFIQNFANIPANAIAGQSLAYYSRMASMNPSVHATGGTTSGSAQSLPTVVGAPVSRSSSTSHVTEFHTVASLPSSFRSDKYRGQNMRQTIAANPQTPRDFFRLCYAQVRSFSVPLRLRSATRALASWCKEKPLVCVFLVTGLAAAIIAPATVAPIISEVLLQNTTDLQNQCALKKFNDTFHIIKGAFTDQQKYNDSDLTIEDFSSQLASTALDNGFRLQTRYDEACKYASSNYFAQVDYQSKYDGLPPILRAAHAQLDPESVVPGFTNDMVTLLHEDQFQDERQKRETFPVSYNEDSEILGQSDEQLHTAPQFEEPPPLFNSASTDDLLVDSADTDDLFTQPPPPPSSAPPVTAAPSTTTSTGPSTTSTSTPTTTSEPGPTLLVNTEETSTFFRPSMVKATSSSPTTSDSLSSNNTSVDQPNTPDFEITSDYQDEIDNVLEGVFHTNFSHNPLSPALRPPTRHASFLDSPWFLPTVGLGVAAFLLVLLSALCFCIGRRSATRHRHTPDDSSPNPGNSGSNAPCDRYVTVEQAALSQRTPAPPAAQGSAPPSSSTSARGVELPNLDSAVARIRSRLQSSDLDQDRQLLLRHEAAISLQNRAQLATEAAAAALQAAEQAARRGFIKAEFYQPPPTPPSPAEQAAAAAAMVAAAVGQPAAVAPAAGLPPPSQPSTSGHGYPPPEGIDHLSITDDSEEEVDPAENSARRQRNLFKMRQIQITLTPPDGRSVHLVATPPPSQDHTYATLSVPQPIPKKTSYNPFSSSSSNGGSMARVPAIVHRTSL